MLKQKILVCDDEPGYLNALKEILEKNGFEVIPAASASEVEAILEDHRPDLILLDRMLPDMDGLVLCRQLKQNERTSAIPIILLTVRSGEGETIMGFEFGADDYIGKPFSPGILLARIKARLPRPQGGGSSAIVEAGQITLNTERLECKIGHKLINLRPKEFELLLFLINNEGKVIRRSTLLSKVWNYDHFGETRTVDATIRNLRKNLGKAGKRIVTVPAVGYKFV